MNKTSKICKYRDRSCGCVDDTGERKAKKIIVYVKCIDSFSSFYRWRDEVKHREMKLLVPSLEPG